MSDNSNMTESQKEQLVKLYRYVAESIKNGKSRQRIIEDVQSMGISEKSATQIVDGVLNAQTKVRANAADTAERDMAFGCMIGIIGLLVTIGTYAAAQGGGTYIVAWGAIAVGLRVFFRGMSNFSR